MNKGGRVIKGLNDRHRQLGLEKKEAHEIDEIEMREIVFDTRTGTDRAHTRLATQLSTTTDGGSERR